MKKTIITVCLAATAALTSCTKDETPQTADKYSGQTVPIEISLSDGSPTTRAGFFDDTADIPSAIEKYIGLIKVYIYDDTGTKAFETTITADAYGSFLTTLEIPKELCGTTCTVYASANADVTLSGNYSAQISNAYYTANTNFPHQADSYAEIIDPAYWTTSRKFIMSAWKNVYIEPYGFKTYVSMELARVEAKVALRVKVADDFATTHGGAALSITGVRLQNLTNSVYIFRDTPYENWNRSLTQTPLVENGYHHNLFYIFPRSGASNPVSILISGIYDSDGNLSTTGDQTSVEYQIPVSTGGEVDRNTFYRIDGVIKGVGSQNFDAQFKVKEWVTIPTQTITMGE